MGSVCNSALVVACLLFTGSFCVPVSPNDNLNVSMTTTSLNATNSSSSNVNQSDLFYPFVLEKDVVDVVIFTLSDLNNDTDETTTVTTTGSYSTHLFRRDVEKTGENSDENCDKDNIMLINKEGSGSPESKILKGSDQQLSQPSSSLPSTTIDGSEKLTTSSSHSTGKDLSSSTSTTGPKASSSPSSTTTPKH